LFSILAAAAAAPQYAAPAVVAPAPAYGAVPLPVYPDVAPAYDYNYGVADSLSGANFGASESRNGYNTQGEYHVALPDGRIQTVSYRTDGDSGHIADVKYSGEAVFAPAPVPAYGAAPLRVAPAPLAIAAPAPLAVAGPAPLAVAAPLPLAARPALLRAPLVAAPLRPALLG